MVVFDAVGTLIRPATSVIEVYLNAGRSRGSQTTRKRVGDRFFTGRKEVFGTSNQESLSNDSFPSCEETEYQLWRKIVDFVFDDLPQTDVLFEELWEHFANPGSWQVFEDVPEALGRLQDQGIQYCVGSNFDARIVPIFQSLLPDIEVDSIHWSSNLGFRKPDRRFYHTIEQRNQGDATSRFVMVGDDRINDYTAPLKYGWGAVLLDRKSKFTNVSQRITNLRELDAQLKRLRQIT